MVYFVRIEHYILYKFADKNSFGIGPPAYMEDIPKYVEFARHTRYAERLTIVL